jgi:hypothetical protein
MKRLVYTCDHCGKEITGSEYTDYEIGDFSVYLRKDLCKSCYDELYTELDNVIENFCKNEKQHYEDEQ